MLVAHFTPLLFSSDLVISFDGPHQTIVCAISIFRCFGWWLQCGSHKEDCAISILCASAVTKPNFVCCNLVQYQNTDIMFPNPKRKSIFKGATREEKRRRTKDRLTPRRASTPLLPQGQDAGRETPPEVQHQCLAPPPERTRRVAYRRQ